MDKRLSRRTVLKGLGTTLALPLMGSLAPSRGVARAATVAGNAAAGGIGPALTVFTRMPWAPKRTAA